ncbi:GIY-YIG nuclease family protein [bacterium]|nr:GIY-YIG nuclease family protein [bacterium]NIN92980.1 GIY-YIG nuclease family protein [bacterium]NIO19044.1 GIY-YIG nuclease family protein [bacterium]NIO74172.1 GIY-YIG nuclease family protein [bacterium]
MFYVYILKSLKDGSYYIGSTSNLKKRIHRHNRGHSVSTKGKKPLVLIYRKEYKQRSEAIREEKRIKSQKSRAYIENLIKAKVGP